MKLKTGKITATILSATLLMTACGTPMGEISNIKENSSGLKVSETVSDTTSSQVSDIEQAEVSQTVSLEPVSSETSSKEEPLVIPDPDKNHIRLINGIKYYDVKDAGAKGNDKIDDSGFFPEDAEGYYIEGKTYRVNEETLNRIRQKPVLGDGAIIWNKYSVSTYYKNPDPFTGVIPVEKLNDPLYMFMCIPSERATSMNRIKATNMYAAESKYKKILTIGALYNNSDMPIPDNAEFTFCLGRTTLILNTKDEGWHIANELKYPARPDRIYYLPWTLEHTLGSRKLDANRVKYFGDHVEIKLTGADLNGGDGKSYGATGSVLHFWGENVMLEDGSDVLGLVTSFEAWVKEEEWAPYLSIAIGADWRTEENVISQAYSGHNYAVSTEPRVIFGHNVGPNSYDEIMDTEKVQEMLHLK